MIIIVSPPLNPIEITEPTAYRTGKRVAFGDLARRLKKRWYIDTSLGRVFFKRLGQLSRDEANLEYADAHPEFADMVRDAGILREFEASGVPLDDAHREKLARLNRSLIPVKKLYASKCIVDIDENGVEKPAFESMEDYDAFLSALLPDEVDAIYATLEDMTSTAPITEESHVALILAKEYNIPIAEGLTLENMTAEVMDALTENAIVRGEETRKLMGKRAGDA